MTIWILTQALSAEEEQAILSKSRLCLPFEGLPDLSTLSSPWQCRDLLQRLEPDAPPEAIQLKLDRLWGQFTAIAVEDIVVVPLPIQKKAAIARITGRYQYEVDDRGNDKHLLAISWYPKLFSFHAFGRFNQPIVKPAYPLTEVSDKDLRDQINSKLPHSYNRFARWKWVIMVVVIIKAILFFLHGLSQP